MKTEFERVDGVSEGIDFDAHYKVKGYNGISWLLLGWAVNFEPIMAYAEDDDGNEIEVESGEFEKVADTSRVVAVMVGDNRRHEIDKDDITVIAEDSFCRSCGQIGCGHNIYV